MSPLRSAAAIIEVKLASHSSLAVRLVAPCVVVEAKLDEMEVLLGIVYMYPELGGVCVGLVRD